MQLTIYSYENYIHNVKIVFEIHDLHCTPFNLKYKLCVILQFNNFITFDQ